MRVQEIWRFIQPRVSYYPRAVPSGNMILLCEYIFIFTSPACNKCILLHSNMISLVECNKHSNMTSFFRFVNKRAIYLLGVISFAHALVHVTDFSVVNVHVDDLSSARIWQHKLCATLSASVNINYRLPIKVYYHICTLRHIRIEIIPGSQNVLWALTWVDGWNTNICQPMLKLKTHSGFHDLFPN